MTSPRVICYPADTTGCGQYRVIMPAKAAKERGAPVECYEPGHEHRMAAQVYTGRDDKDHVSEVTTPAPGDADVLVFQRTLDRTYIEAMAKLRAAGFRLVLELDDDFKAVSPRNVFFDAVHPARSPEANWNHLDRALRLVHTVVTSSASLAHRYGRRAEVVATVPNYVPRRMLTLPPFPRRPGSPDVVIGWPGSLGSHPDDFTIAARGVREAMRDTGAHFRCVGEGATVAKVLGVDPALCESTGWLDLNTYYRASAALDVGVAPLAASTFNNAKSWLKPLELSALGVPVVMSPAPEYVALHELHGLGVIAATDKDWRREVRRLAADAELRAEVGAEARRIVAEHRLTIEDRWGEFFQAWTAGA